MRTELRAGSTLETLTPDELEETLGRVLGERFPNRRGPQVERPYQGVALDANGNGTVELYKVPNGHTFRLHRLRVSSDGYTPAVPFVNAAGYIEIKSEGHGQDFALLSDGIPAVWTSSVGIFYHSLEVVEIQLVGGPVSGAVICRAQGVLEPVTAT